MIKNLLKNLRGSPVDFVRKMLKAEPDIWQREILDAFPKNNRLAIRSGHGVGKSTLLSWLILYFLFVYPYSRVIATAPTARQINDVLWSELSRWLTRSELLKEIFDFQKTSIRFKTAPERWFAVARTASTPESFAGQHADNLLYVVDEASGVDDNIFEVIEGALTGGNNKLILTSNPTRASGFFFRAFHQDRSLYHLKKVSSLESARVNRDYAERLIKTYGIDSNVVRVRVLGEFPKADSDGLIALEWIEKAIRSYELGVRTENVVIGVDVARFGDDQTVQAVRAGDSIISIKKWQHADLMETCGRIAQTINKKTAQVNIDVGGMGAGVVDRLRELGFTVNAVDFGGKSARKDCANKATEMYFNLRDVLQTGELTLPDDELLAAELSTRKYSVDSAGRFILERKSDYKKRIGHSPDTADAVALCFANCINIAPPSFVPGISYWR